MTATVSLEPFASTVLAPGHYWVEIATERPLGKAVLAAALAEMGFQRVRFEHKDPVAVPGTFSSVFGLTGPSTIASRAAAASPQTVSRVAQVAATPVKTSSPITDAQVKAVAQAAQVAASVVQQSMPIATQKAVPFSIDQNAAAYAAAQAAKAKTAAAAAVPTRSAPAPAPTSFAVPAKPSAPNGYAAPSSPAPSYASATPAFDPTQAGHDYVPPRNLPMEEEAGGPAPPSPLERAGVSAESVAAVAPPLRPSNVSVGPGCTLMNPGSQSPMYLCPPQKPSVFGAASSTTRVCRFTAYLPRPLTLTSSPEMRFQAVHRLAFDPSSALTDEPRGPTLRIQPFRLNTGVVYDLRFLSRDKTARSKEAVKMLLERMGFSPVEVLLLARDQHHFRRPTSLSEWLGVGTWRAPVSIVTSEDPFYFAEARPSP